MIYNAFDVSCVKGLYQSGWFGGSNAVNIERVNKKGHFRDILLIMYLTGLRILFLINIDAKENLSTPDPTEMVLLPSLGSSKATLTCENLHYLALFAGPGGSYYLSSTTATLFANALCRHCHEPQHVNILQTKAEVSREQPQNDPTCVRRVTPTVSP